jgi:uncharacterized linocin/CFP29 family protein
MVDLLKRSIAPITQAGWDEIDDAAMRVFKSLLSARTLVDFDGPHGWDYAAVNQGRLKLGQKEGKHGVPWGTREVLPLIELRVPFTLNQMEIDNASRGCKRLDVSAVEEAAQKVAMFEEEAIYKGFSDGQIQGIINDVEHKPVKLGTDAESFPQSVADAVKTLKLAGIEGSFALVLGRDSYYTLMHAGSKSGYPPHLIVKQLLGEGPIVWSPALEGGLVLATRGGDFEQVVGQDLAIGYASHNREEVELFITESFTFRVIEPAAGIELKLAKK